jgi:integrase
MTIYKRGGVYWCTFERDGRRIRQSTRQSNPKAARDIESAIKTKLAEGDFGILKRKKVPIFAEAMTAFLAWSKNQHGEKSGTYLRYSYSSIPLLCHFKNTQIDKISATDVEKYKTTRLQQYTTARVKNGRKATGKKIAPATVNRELACLRLMFNDAIKSKIQVENPVGKMGAKALRENNEQTRVLSYDEEAKYLAAATPILRDVATVMLETGMRPEEVYRIRAEHVDLNKNNLFNPYGKTKAAKRHIHLTAKAKSVLEWRMGTRQGRYLFAHSADPNKPAPKMTSAHRRAVMVSGIAPARLYDCRHTWATRAVESGIDLVTLAAKLGHSKINMVMRYAHPTQEHQTQAGIRMEQYVEAQRRAAALKSGVSQIIQ